MASLFLGPPKDENGNPKKIPKVAVYVAGAAFAVTTGLTLLVLPFVRQAARMNSAPTFLSNRNMLRTPPSPSAPLAGPAEITHKAATGTTGPTGPTVDTVDSIETVSHADKAFNDTEEISLYGALEGNHHDPVSPWLGAQALGVATLLVFGSAGLGAWGVAKALGVESMSEFTSKMRETLTIQMPALGQALSKEAPAQTEVEKEETRPWVALWDEIKRDVARADGEKEGQGEGVGEVVAGVLGGTVRGGKGDSRLV